MVELYGDAGAAWLTRLPGLVEECATAWKLVVGPPFALTYNYVAPATRADGTRAVLKIGYPDTELWSEVAALELDGGRGLARLLAVDRERAALLLERLEPGRPLTTLGDDEQATRVAAGVMRALWQPAPAAHSLPTTHDWARGFTRLRAQHAGGTGPLPPTLVDEAERLYAELHADAAPPALLHGDLHHDNILSAARAPWLAIDPKGLIGEPAYEPGALLRNPLPWLLAQPDPRATQARRIAILAEELGFDRQRLRAWGLAQAVLSAVWSLEDEGYGWEPAIACATILQETRV
jgi:streptomycin 6-kinase